MKIIKQIAPLIKVITITAYSFEELIKQALKIGAIAILYKPLDIKKIVEIIGIND